VSGRRAGKSPAEAKPARNACKMCSPLGACLAFSGVAGGVPLLHGSQGCATYIRRYLISHFREPLDVASSNFGERAAIFGGEENLRTALANVAKGYSPSLVGVATTCLSETIGDDVAAFLSRIPEGERPPTVHASTPAYSGTHFDGYVRAVRALVETLAREAPRERDAIALFPGIVSPADLRWLRSLVEGFALRPVIVPDYADRLDGGCWEEYQRIPPGGTAIQEIRGLGGAAASLETTWVAGEGTAAAWLEERFGVPWHRIGLPVGLQGTDELIAVLAETAGREVGEAVSAERARLVDSYVDAHKYVFDRRTLLFGEEDLVIALARFCVEIGLKPVLCASGGTSGRLSDEVRHWVGSECEVRSDVDFEDVADLARDLSPEILIGNSKGAKLARRLKRPLVRVGLPIHDRIGAARVQHLGYPGTQQLFDRVVNALLEARQDEDGIGYSYL
jgi:nitrogenase molybdenum-iron protein NifN